MGFISKTKCDIFLYLCKAIHKQEQSANLRSLWCSYELLGSFQISVSSFRRPTSFFAGGTERAQRWLCSLQCGLKLNTNRTK